MKIRMNMAESLASIVFLIFMMNATHGASLVVNNFSFETPDTANGTFSGSTTLGPTGWTVYNTGPTNTNRYFGVWDPTGTLSYDVPPPHGQQIGVVFLDDALSSEAGLVQTLSDILQLSTQYTLSVGVGNF